MTEAMWPRSDLPPAAAMTAVRADPRRAASTATGAGVRYRPLGSFRFFLALCVVFQHFANLAPAWFKAAGMRVDVGSLAVLVFFVLSGLVITEAAHRFYADRPGAFILNRFIRLLPVAALVIVLNTAIWAGLVAPTPVPVAEVGLTVLRAVLSLFPFTPRDPAAFDPLPVAWALRVEFLFYFVCFGLLVARRHLRSERLRAALVLSGLLILAGLFLTDVVRGRSTLLSFIPHFTLGASVYFAGCGGYRWRRAAQTTAALALAGVFLQLFVAPEDSQIAGAYHDKLAQALILGAMLTAALVLGTRRAGSRFARADRRWGDLSYPTYMGHYTVQILALAFLPRCAASYVVAWPAALLVAVALWKVGEQPIGLIRNRIRGRAIR